MPHGHQLAPDLPAPVVVAAHDARARVVDRHADGPDRLHHRGLRILSAGGERQALRAENGDGEPEERDERQETETNAACHTQTFRPAAGNAVRLLVTYERAARVFRAGRSYPAVAGRGRQRKRSRRNLSARAEDDSLSFQAKPLEHRLRPRVATRADPACRVERGARESGCGRRARRARSRPGARGRAGSRAGQPARRLPPARAESGERRRRSAGGCRARRSSRRPATRAGTIGLLRPASFIAALIGRVDSGLLADLPDLDAGVLREAAHGGHVTSLRLAGDSLGAGDGLAGPGRGATRGPAAGCGEPAGHRPGRRLQRGKFSRSSLIILSRFLKALATSPAAIFPSSRSICNATPA